MKKLALLLLLAPALASAATTTAVSPQPGAAWQQEVSHLIGYLEQSGCQFKRSGNWQPASDAVSHLTRKYRYLSEHGLASSAEDFIHRAASQSRTTGKPYMVRCEDGRAQSSALWLGAELQRYRSKH